jgi:peptide/nickel transport system substrate-binding protein
MLVASACSSVASPSPGGTTAATTTPSTQSTPGAPAKTTLVIGANMSDINSLDPEKQFTLFSPTPTRAAYETLITTGPGDFTTIYPLLAKTWELSADGTAWIFHLQDGVKFASGNPFTADDVVFSYDRLKNLKIDASAVTANFGTVEAVDPMTVKITMVDKDQPLIAWLVSTNFSVVDSKLVKEHGGISDATADTKDTATTWLEAHSAGTGAYQLDSWTRDGEITMSRNPSYWRAPAPFEKVIIKHIPDGATQLLQITNGDIDVALNLGADQLATLNGNADIRIVRGQSLDTMYLALSVDGKKSPGLGSKLGRQAILSSIDYDGIINQLYGGNAIRPFAFIPIGLGGSTVELNNQFGYKGDIPHAKDLLTQAGLPNGFEFKLTYATNSGLGGLSYDVVAQKIKSDLARAGITANLDPQEEGNMRTAYRAGQNDATLTFWGPDAPDPALYADPATQRVALRVNWTVPQDMLDLVKKADGEKDAATRAGLYIDFQKKLADTAILQVIFQPQYGDAVRSSIATWDLNFSASFHVDMYSVTPKT